jgi:hypothetical protein
VRGLFQLDGMAQVIDINILDHQIEILKHLLIWGTGGGFYPEVFRLGYILGGPLT